MRSYTNHTYQFREYAEMCFMGPQSLFWYERKEGAFTSNRPYAPWSIILLRKPVVPYLIMKFPQFYVTLRFIQY
jgi:hypothetical protein